MANQVLPNAASEEILAAAEATRRVRNRVVSTLTDDDIAGLATLLAFKGASEIEAILLRSAEPENFRLINVFEHVGIHDPSSNAADALVLLGAIERAATSKQPYSVEGAVGIIKSLAMAVGHNEREASTFAANVVNGFRSTVTPRSIWEFLCTKHVRIALAAILRLLSRVIDPEEGTPAQAQSAAGSLISGGVSGKVKASVGLDLSKLPLVGED